MDTVKFRLKIYLIVFLAVMIFGTAIFMIVEGLSLADAFYFCIVTMATVGYGDIHPVTQAGKIIAVFLIIMGVGTFLGVVANATEMMLNRREKQHRMEKLNIVVGIFFSDVGTRLLGIFSELDTNLDNIRKDMIITDGWTEEDFLRVSKRLKGYDYGVDIQKFNLEELRTFLLSKRDFLVGLLENPTMMEHESFTALLWAIFHLYDELAHRENMGPLPSSDLNHIKGDIKRVYNLLVDQWVDYMAHLKGSYPYLFSLALRTNPFDREASPIVK